MVHAQQIKHAVVGDGAARKCTELRFSSAGTKGLAVTARPFSNQRSAVISELAFLFCVVEKRFCRGVLTDRYAFAGGGSGNGAGSFGRGSGGDGDGSEGNGNLPAGNPTLSNTQMDPRL